MRTEQIFSAEKESKYKCYSSRSYEEWDSVRDEFHRDTPEHIILHYHEELIEWIKLDLNTPPTVSIDQAVIQLSEYTIGLEQDISDDALEYFKHAASSIFVDCIPQYIIDQAEKTIHAKVFLGSKSSYKKKVNEDTLTPNLIEQLRNNEKARHSLLEKLEKDPPSTDKVLTEEAKSLLNRLDTEATAIKETMVIFRHEKFRATRVYSFFLAVVDIACELQRKMISPRQMQLLAAAVHLIPTDQRKFDPDNDPETSLKLMQKAYNEMIAVRKKVRKVP